MKKKSKTFWGGGYAANTNQPIENRLTFNSKFADTVNYEIRTLYFVTLCVTLCVFLRYITYINSDTLSLNLLNQTCYSKLADITCTTKLINTVARLVRAHLDFCTSCCQTQ